jgi:hypothetical protein
MQTVWPLAVVVIVIFFMIFFRRDIRTLLGRVREISRQGIRTSPEAPQEAPDLKQESLEELMKAFDSLALREREKLIRKELEARGLKEDPHTIKVLIRHLAGTQLCLVFERVNSLIWGSQIAILEFLNSARQGALAESIKGFYDAAAARYPDAFKEYSFEDYLGFLLSTGLLVKDNGQHRITQMGVEFLSYLAATGRTGFRSL